MCALLKFIVVIALFKFSLAAPALRIEDDPELTAGYFEGDMEIELDRNGLLAETSRWPNATIYYKIDDVFDSAHQDHIRAGMKQIEVQSCLRFYPATAENIDVLRFIGEPSGCHTRVGYRGGEHTLNLQVYSLDTGCFRLGTIQHEILHALGFYHQQSAPERDDFVHIAVENIREGHEHNFNKYPEDVVENYDTEYDYGSVLHYSTLAFSKNGKQTIVPLREEGVIIGQRVAMSKKDVTKLKVMYKCPVQM